jgi:uncharacterized protein (TIGR00661 family)
MRILYGISGEGMGHVAHASEIAKYLQDKNHKVKIITYGKGIDFLKDFDVFPVEGLHAIYKNGKLSYSRSVFYNLRNFPKNILKQKEISKMVDEFAPDVCITDDEPIVSRIAYSRKIPLVSSSMMNTFVYKNEKVPFLKKHHQVISKMVTKAITPKADKIIAIALVNQVSNENKITYAPPIIRSAVKRLKTEKKDFILVYISKSNENLIELLKKIDERFFIYGSEYNRNKGNLVFKKEESFLKDLAECKAIISTAGFTLISEAIYLKKPIFTVPLIGQYEQFFNARTVKEKGFGDFSEKPSAEDINYFISGLEKSRKNLLLNRFNADTTLKIIENSIIEVKKQQV